MKTTVKTITPSYAKMILEKRNPRNRPISAAAVDKYARDIANNCFTMTHQGIAFYPDGTLADGQHRLLAVVKANKPVELNVSTDVPEKVKVNGIWVHTFEAIDSGRKRTVGQMLAMNGCRNANKVAAVCRSLAGMVMPDGENVHISTPQAEKVLHLFKGMIQTVVNESMNTTSNPPASAVAPLAFYRLTFPDQAKQYTDSLFSLEGLTKSHPALIFTRWLRHNNSAGWSGQTSARNASANAIHAFHQNLAIQRLGDSERGLSWLVKQSATITCGIQELFA